MAADGSDSISMLINPQSIQRGSSANTAKYSIYNSTSRVFWVSDNPETINITLVISGGIYTDISPILDQLRAAVGRKWRYIHNQRVLPTAILTSLDIDERQWYDGKPSMADVSLQFMAAGESPIAVITYQDPSLADVADYLNQAAALGYTDLTAQGSDIYSHGSLIGSGSDGTFVPS